ncbi:GNAT family N-acetyltransferase [Micromonospora sp. WMMC241]|uniref:GNAT family N-acetyltransferase n=1 Tax=Micromonospora sp. WMMC241 TaxID=3015159 RepID=UPI0022B6D08F|nr:GNAT family N-acetyltransferase [Micromonospora sp. WMMC241]MCZ7438922.1 GNAT family N-acetyltransferase [Micromonospora sp. WMMC241]
MALWRIRATVDDRPGYLSVLTASLALRGVNILTVQVHTTEVGAVDDFLVDAPEQVTEAELHAAVERGRGRDCWVARSEARGLADEPTRVLGLAARLVRDPEAAGATLRTLLGADAVTWRPTPAAAPGGVGGTTMLLADPAGGGYELRRREPSFTPAEYARAQAVVELAATLGRRDTDRVTLVLPDGAEVSVRPATADDVPAVRELHVGCSARSRQRRYLSGAADPSPARLRRLLEPARGLTLLVTAGSGGAAEPVVAMANLLGEGDEAEAALLVRDDWQRRGLGSALLRRLLGHADRAGYAAVLLHVQAENTPMLRTLRRLDRPVTLERDGGVLTATLPLTPAEAGPAARVGVPAGRGPEGVRPAWPGRDAVAGLPAQRPGSS